MKRRFFEKVNFFVAWIVDQKGAILVKKVTLLSQKLHTAEPTQAIYFPEIVLAHPMLSHKPKEKNHP